MNHPITLQEKFYFIKICKSNNSGPDQIPFAFIHNFCNKTFDILATLNNKILKEEVYPTIWKCGIVISILKPKEKFYTDGYRPIILLNTICKLLEKIINYRLQWLLKKHVICFPHKNGFRKNLSTLDNMIEIKEKIIQTFNDKQILGIINLDIAKVYDST